MRRIHGAPFRVELERLASGSDRNVHIGLRVCTSVDHLVRTLCKQTYLIRLLDISNLIACGGIHNRKGLAADGLNPLVVDEQLQQANNQHAC